MQKKVINLIVCLLLCYFGLHASTIRSFVMKENFTDWQTRHSSSTISVITGKEKDIGLWVLIGNTQNGESVRIVINKNGVAVFEKTFLAGGYANDVIFFNDPFTSWENTEYILVVTTPNETKSFPIPVKITSSVTQTVVVEDVTEKPDDVPLKNIADAIKEGKLDDALALLQQIPAGDSADTFAAALLDAYLEEYDFEGAIKACELLRRTADGTRRSEEIYNELRNRETLEENATVPALQRYYHMKRLLKEKNISGIDVLLKQHPKLKEVFSQELSQLTKKQKTPFRRYLFTAIIAVLLPICVVYVRNMRPDHLKKGLTAYQEQRYADAAVSLEKYIKQTQSVDVSIYRRLAEVYVKLDDFEKALEVYKQCDALLHAHIKEA